MSKHLVRSNSSPGEYVSPHDRSGAQQQFFGCIQKCAPEVLVSLWETVLPIYKDQKAGEERLDGGIWDWAAQFRLVTRKRWDPTKSLPRKYHKKPGTDEALSIVRRSVMYSAEWTFFHPWVWPVVMQTLRDWARFAEKPEALEWSPPLRVAPTPGRVDLADLARLEEKLGCAFPLPLPRPVYHELRWREWDSRRETWDRYEARVRELLNGHLTREKRVKEEDARKEGLLGHKDLAILHLEWLVRYQVQLWSHNDIAKEYGCTRPTVVNGLERAAEAVIGSGWRNWLRATGKPGRPPSH
jgi:hypothetical protein